MDSNRNLLHFLDRLMSDAGWQVFTARSAKKARKLMEHKPDVALLGYMLPDSNGVELGVELQQIAQRVQVIVMSSGILPPEEEEMCEKHDIPFLRKDLLLSNLLALTNLKSTLWKSLVPRRIACWAGLVVLGIAKLTLAAGIPRSGQLRFGYEDRFFIAKYNREAGPRGGIDIVETLSGEGSPEGPTVISIRDLPAAILFLAEPDKKFKSMYPLSR